MYDLIYTIAFFAGRMFAGTLFGLIPFFIGRKSNPKLARIALIVCALGSLLHAWITFIAAIAFSVILTSQKRKS